MQAGDIVLVHGNSFYSKLISFGQGIRFRGKKHYKYWTHVAIVASDNGDLIEAIWPKIARTHISKYDEIPHQVVDISKWASIEDRQQILKFAEHAEGTEYGLVEAVSLGIYCAIGWPINFSIGNQLICSALAAEALCRTSIIFPKEPLRMFPADHAKFFDVCEPTDK